MIRQMLLYLLHFLVLFTQESSSQRSFCPQGKPVINFCKTNQLTNVTEVNMDTNNVPTYQASACECIIFSFKTKVSFSFSFSYFDNFEPNSMVFKIEDNEITSAGISYTWITDSANIFLLTSKNHTGGACLSVYTEDNTFDIRCMKSNSSKTISSTSSTMNVSETSIGQDTDTDPNTDSYTENNKATVIVPIVATLSGLAVLVIVILVGIVCRRRLSKKEGQSATPSACVEKEDNDDYYMTENPMYNATDIPPKTQHSESEYQYIEHDNHGVHMSSDQYESFPDSSLRKQLPPNEEVEHEHYDYSKCLSNSEKGQSTTANKQALKTNKAGASLPSDQSAGTENMYDRTDNTLAKPFMGENEYHHLTPTGPRRMAAVDTYNTVGSAGNNKHEQERNVEESEYHVTSSR